MNEWISVKEGKPEQDGLVYVTNTKAGVHCYMALYYKGHDFFQEYNPQQYQNPPIEVTHWVYLPTAPRHEE